MYPAVMSYPWIIFESSSFFSLSCLLNDAWSHTTLFKSSSKNLPGLCLARFLARSLRLSSSSSLLELPKFGVRRGEGCFLFPHAGDALFESARGCVEALRDTSACLGCNVEAEFCREALRFAPTLRALTCPLVFPAFAAPFVFPLVGLGATARWMLTLRI